MERARPTSPGLKWRPRKGGAVPYWIASPAAVRAGFQPKAVRLSGSESAILARAERLQAEMLHFLGRGDRTPAFDGTWRSLFGRYERDAESPFAALRPGSLHPYKVYLRKLYAHIGDRRISECDGRDVLRWYAVWSGGDGKHNGKKLGAAQTTLAIVKSALSWGVQCRLPGCADLLVILREIEFPHLKRRGAAPTAAEVERIRAAARAGGQPSRALAYALQFEAALRQWDVIGEWLPLSDPRPSAVLGPAGKWIGLQWHHIGADLVLRYTPSKTDESSGLAVAVDLRECPMVLDELARVPPEARRGPVIVHEATRRPYLYQSYRSGWRRDFTAAGIPKGVWNRDLRAGGATEARKAGASTDDVQKLAGHADRETTEIYDRAALEAHRRVARARKAFREGGDV